MKTQNDELMDTEQPVVTAQTKFRRGGFKPAAEVIAEAGAAAQEQQEGAPAEQEDPEFTAAVLTDQTVNIELDGTPLTAAAETAGEPEAQGAEETPAEEPKFKIRGREFASQEEAWAFAEEEMAKAEAADAFRQGVELATKMQTSNTPPQAAEPEVPREIDPLYYTDPQAYFAKREAEIIARAETVIETKAKQKQTHDQTWNQFYTDYPDLANAREFVDMTLQQNWGVLQHIETKQALKQLAEKTRAKLKPIIEAQLPKVALPRVKTAASPGGVQTVTAAAAPKQALNFAQQLKNHKKNRAQFR